METRDVSHVVVASELEDEGLFEQLRLHRQIAFQEMTVEKHVC